MKMDEYLDEYSASHQNEINKIIHKICVPAIFLSILGILESIPFIFPLSYLLIAFSFIFYIKKETSLKLILGMLILTIVYEIILKNISMPFKLYLSIGIFAVAWVVQFIGHHIEGKRPSFLKDLLFLLIGPLWVLKDLFKL